MRFLRHEGDSEEQSSCRAIGMGPSQLSSACSVVTSEPWAHRFHLPAHFRTPVSPAGAGRLAFLGLKELLEPLQLRTCGDRPVAPAQNSSELPMPETHWVNNFEGLPHTREEEGSCGLLRSGMAPLSPPARFLMSHA